MRSAFRLTVIDHLRRRALEIDVVLEEVGVAEDMGDHQLVLQQVVLLHQEGIRRVGVDHHLVDLAQPVVVLRLHAVVGFAARPVAEAARQPIRAELVHDGRRHQLEVDRERVQAHAARNVPDLLDGVVQVGDVFIIGHCLRHQCASFTSSGDAHQGSAVAGSR